MRYGKSYRRLFLNCLDEKSVCVDVPLIAISLGSFRAGYDFKRLFTISEYYDRDRSKFYRAIQSVRKKNMDMTEWLEYFIEGLSTQMNEVVVRGEATIRADIMQREYNFNERQTAAIRHILENQSASINDLEKLTPGIVRRTLQRDMKILVEKGILKEFSKSKTDPTKRYEINPEIIK